MFSPFRCVVAALLASSMLAVPASAGGLKHYHIFATPSYSAKIGYAPGKNSGSMHYFGGPVFSNSKVASVLWGSSVNSTSAAAIPGFTAALVNSTYVDQLAEYGTHPKNHGGTRQTIGRGTYLGQIRITPQNNSTSLTDDDIRKELQYQIKQGYLPEQDPNTLYMIYLPRDVSVDLDGLISCQDFGAYHFSTVPPSNVSKKPLFYIVQPDCNSGMNFIEYAASREFAGATTDNSPTPGLAPAFPQAWTDRDGAEIGDKCRGSGTLKDNVSGKVYVVAQVFLNSRNGCSVGNYTSP